MKKRYIFFFLFLCLFYLGFNVVDVDAITVLPSTTTSIGWATSSSASYHADHDVSGTTYTLYTAQYDMTNVTTINFRVTFNNPPTGNGFVGGNATTYFKDCNTNTTLWSGTVSSSGSDYSYSTVNIPIASLRSSGKDLSNVQIVVSGNLTALYYGNSSVSLDNVAINGTGNKLSAASGSFGWSVGSASYHASHDWGSKNYSLFTGTYNMVQVKTLSFNITFNASDNGNGRGSGNATIYLKDCNTGSTIWSTVTSGQNVTQSVNIPVETLIKNGKDLSNIQVGVGGSLSSVYYANTSVGVSGVSYTAYTLPSITSNIENVTVNVGETANFEVTATNTLAYQWQYTSDGITWNDISGENTSTFSIENVPYSYNKYKYRCVLTGGYGDINSDEAILTVNDITPPTISVKSDAVGDVASQIITVTAIDSGSGLADKAYAMTKLGSSEIEYVSSNKFTITENGTYVFYARDKAGLESNATLVVTNIDSEPPLVSVKSDATGEVVSQIVTVTATDTKSGLADKAYAMTKLGNSEIEYISSNKFTITENDTYIFYAIDKAGNVGTATLVVTNIDVTPPSVSVETSVIGSIVTEEQTALVIAKDTGVGLHSEAFAISKIGEQPSTWQKFNSFKITENDTYIFYARDKAGNIGYSTLTITNIKTLEEQGLKKYYILPNGSLVDDYNKIQEGLEDIKIEFRGKGATSGEIIVNKEDKVVNAIMMVTDYTVSYDGKKYSVDTSRPTIIYEDNNIYLENKTGINAYQITTIEEEPSIWININEVTEKNIDITDFNLEKGIYYIWCKSSNNIVSGPKKIKID